LVKKLDIYVWRELLVPFLIGSVAVSLMFSINQLMAIMKEISVQNVPKEAIILSLVYKLPFWMNMTLPVGMSLAASLAFTRFSRESELTAMRAAGTSIVRVIRPVMLFGLVVAIGNFLLVEKVMPKSEQKFNEIARKVGILGIMPVYQSNVVIHLKDYTASFASVSRSSKDVLQIRGVTLIRRPSETDTEIISAGSGQYDDGIWRLNKAYFWMLHGLVLTGFHGPDDFVVDQRVIIDDMLNPRTQESQTAEELLAAINNGKKTGLDTRTLEVSYHSRYSVPAACILFACVAPVFAILFARTGGFAGVLLSIFLVMLYYNVYVVCTEIFGRLGWMPPIIAAWLPNIVFAIAGIFALRKLE